MPNRAPARRKRRTASLVALAAFALNGCASPPREPRRETAPAAPERAAGTGDRVADLVRDGQLRRAFRLARDGARERPGERRLLCHVVELATSLGDYATASRELPALEGAGRVSDCDVPGLRAELERLRKQASPADEARAAALHAAALAAVTAGRLAEAQASLLEAWNLAHPNGLWLTEAGAIASLRKRPLEAQALYDRGVTELELRTGAHVRAAPPRRIEQPRALESGPGGALAVADPGGLSVFDAAFNEVRRFSAACGSVAWTAPEALFCAADDGRVLRFDPEAAASLELARLPGRFPCIASRAGVWVAVGGGRALLGDGVTPPAELPVADARGCALSPDAELIALGLDSGELVLVSRRTKGVLRRLRRPAGEPAGAIRVLHFSDDGRFLAASSQTGRARVVRVADGRLRALVPFTGAFRFSPDGKHLVTTGRRYPIDSPQPPEAIPHQGPLALAGSGAESVSVTLAGAIVAEPLDGGPVRELRPAVPGLEHGFDLTLGALAAAARNAGRYPWPVEHDDRPTPSACSGAGGVASGDGRYVVCGGANIVLRDAAGGAGWSVPAPLVPADPLELSVEQRLVLLGGALGQAALLDLESGRTLAHVTLVRADFQNGAITARGYVTDPAGNLGFIGPEPPGAAPGAACLIGAFVLPLDVCRGERVFPGLLAALLARQK